VWTFRRLRAQRRHERLGAAGVETTDRPAPPLGFSGCAKVDHFIAISTEIQNRIQRYYQRDSVLIYPPVDIRRYAPQPEIGDYYLIVSRLIPTSGSIWRLRRLIDWAGHW